MKTVGTDWVKDTDFLTTISLSLFCSCVKVFTHTNTRMIGKNLMKLYYLGKKIFTVT